MIVKIIYFLHIIKPIVEILYCLKLIEWIIIWILLYFFLELPVWRQRQIFNNWLVTCSTILVLCLIFDINPITGKESAYSFLYATKIYFFIHLIFRLIGGKKYYWAWFVIGRDCLADANYLELYRLTIFAISEISNEIIYVIIQTFRVVWIPLIIFLLYDFFDFFIVFYEKVLHEGVARAWGTVWKRYIGPLNGFSLIIDVFIEPLEFILNVLFYIIYEIGRFYLQCANIPSYHINFLSLWSHVNYSTYVFFKLKPLIKKL